MKIYVVQIGNENIYASSNKRQAVEELCWALALSLKEQDSALFTNTGETVVYSFFQTLSLEELNEMVNEKIDIAEIEIIV